MPSTAPICRAVWLRAPPTAKRSVDNALTDPAPGLCEEERLFSQTLLDPDAIARMERFMELGGQTRDVELDVAALYSKLS